MRFWPGICQKQGPWRARKAAIFYLADVWHGSKLGFQLVKGK